MRIRAKVRRHVHVPAADALWLANYEEKINKGKGASGSSKSASRKVSYTEEENMAEAEGTGSAAEMAAGAAMVYEEGRRQDLVVDRGISALEKAVECYRSIAVQLLAERKQDGILQRSMMEAVREHYIKRAEAEAELIHAEADHHAESGQDPQQELEQQALAAMIEQFMAKKGIPTPGGSPNGKKR